MEPDRFQRALVTPIRPEGENRFLGGLYDDQGRFLPDAVHRRSSTGEIQFPDEQGFPLTQADIPVIEQPCLYGGVLFNHFGHFLAESLGRLWPCDQAPCTDLPIYVHPIWGLLDLETSGRFGRASLELLGVEPQRIRFITRPMRFERLLIPEQLYGFHLFERPDQRFVAFLRRGEARMRSSLAIAPPTPRRLYVSRSLWHPEKGLVAGETEFEQFLAARGWSVFHPEEFDFRQQLLHYAKAQQLIFSDGSAYHTLVLLPALRAQIAVILRRLPGWNQDRIEAQFNGLGQNMVTLQHVERVLSFGLPIWAGVSIVDYEHVAHDLIELGFLDQAFTQWPSIKDKAIDRELAKYVAAIADDERFLAFLREAG